MSDNLPQLSKSITEDLHTESMWDWDFLPPEILIQSLSLLPIKTLITCTSIPKTWKSLIQNPTIISTHLNHSKNNHLFLFRLCSKQLSEATRCKEYAVVSSWTKIFTYAVPGFGYHVPRPIAFRRSGEVILELPKRQLVSQDLESKKIKNLGMTGYGYTFAGSYVESLVLLDKPDRAVTY